jgi:putative ABC transport system permease protein
MKALNMKMLRDVRASGGQVFAIAMVIAAGIATFIMSLSTLESMMLTRDRYYHDYRFADIFASLKRAPEVLADRIQAIPGVSAVQTRVVANAKLEIPGFDEPVTGLVVSLPATGQSQVNKLYLRKGRMPDPVRDDEVVLNEVFADAHGLGPGDSLAMIVKGRLKQMHVVGVALSPEFILQIAPGAIMPDYKRYGVMWMSRDALENAYDMDGAFNDVVLRTTRNASKEDIIQRLDQLLAPYGGLDAVGRQWQMSHRFLDSEFLMLRQMAIMFSAIFLGIAAFLLNIVVSRMINSQREQIASLKAFGYGNTHIALHYISFIAVIITAGMVVGISAGAWLGRSLSGLYMEYYRFPILEYGISIRVLVTAFLVTAVAALLGTVYAVIRASMLAPAEAMQPEVPASYHRAVLEKLGLGRLLGQPERMITRHMERKPVKATLSVIGLAMACAIMVFGTFFRDAIDYMVEIEFGLAQRQDITVTFTEPTSYKAYFDILRMRGVQYGEVFRTVPVRFVHEQHEYRTVLHGLDRKPDLYRPVNIQQKAIPIPKQGIVITNYLARLLHVRPGDNVTVEVQEGRRPVLRLPVESLASQYIGVNAYMQINALNAIMQEGDAISGVYLKVDPAYENAVLTELKDMPRVANTDVRSHVLESFYEHIGENTFIFVGFISVLAGVITFGVVYNSMRIALTERSRELASMRVLGFTRGEISYILLGELFLLTLLALPLGLFIGYQLCRVMIAHVQLDIFRIPLIIEPSTYAMAASVVLIASILSGLLVRSKLDHLDLVAVLKTRE